MMSSSPACFIAIIMSRFCLGAISLVMRMALILEKISFGLPWSRLLTNVSRRQDESRRWYLVCFQVRSTGNLRQQEHLRKKENHGPASNHHRGSIRTPGGDHAS